MEAKMAAKKKTVQSKPAAKQVTQTVMKTAKAAIPAPMDFSAFTKAFSQIPQFKPMTMETNMFKNEMFKGNKQMEKMAQNAATMGQDQMEAVVKASTIFAKGMEEMMKSYMEIAQMAGEKSQTAAKTMMSCKTLNEFTDAQTRLAQSSFDEFMTTATKMSEKAVKLLTETMEPINDQIGKTMKRASDSKAA